MNSLGFLETAFLKSLANSLGEDSMNSFLSLSHVHLVSPLGLIRIFLQDLRDMFLPCIGETTFPKCES